MWNKIKEIFGMIFNINPIYIGKKRYVEKLIKDSEIKKDLESMNTLSKFNQFKNRRIVCLCGSTRFEQPYENKQILCYYLTLRIYKGNRSRYVERDAYSEW